MTTEPPVKSILNYTSTVPYYLMLFSFGSTVVSVFEGSLLVFVVLGEIPAVFFREVSRG